jgi:hypothetical protein
MTTSTRKDDKPNLSRLATLNMNLEKRMKPKIDSVPEEAPSTERLQVKPS